VFACFDPPTLTADIILPKTLKSKRQSIRPLGAQARVWFEAEVWPKDYSYATSTRRSHWPLEQSWRLKADSTA